MAVCCQDFCFLSCLGVKMSFTFSVMGLVSSLYYASFIFAERLDFVSLCNRRCLYM